MTTIGIIGYGNMGSSLCRGLKSKDIGFLVSEKKQERVDALKKDCGLGSTSLRELAKKAEVLIIAVKPQELETLTAELAPAAAGKRFISVIAGTRLAFFSTRFKTEQVCRFMPNLAAMAGQAAVGVSFHDKAEEIFRKDCLAIAGGIGKPFLLPEELMPAFTGLSGSGIAYVFSFLHALALGGTAAGIRYDESLRIAQETVSGALAVLEKSGEHPITLLSKVISPAGTTIEGVKRLEEYGFSNAVIKAVEDAARRAKDLEK